MFKLTPLTAAILVMISAQAMADDSLSNQSQVGTANIADVKQTQAPFSTATQTQLGQGNDAAAVQDHASSVITQDAVGDYNAAYAEQLYEDNATITQQQIGAFNTAHASQSLGFGSPNNALQQQQGTGNFSFVYQDSQNGSEGKTFQFGDSNEANIEQLYEGSGNSAVITQYGTANYGTAEQVLHNGGQIGINQAGEGNYAYGDQRNGTGGNITINQFGNLNGTEIWQDAQLASQATALGQVLMIDLVLAGDNAVAVGLAAAALAPEQRKKAILIGLAAAVVLRIGFALITVQLLAIIGLLLAGGVLLLWVCWKMWRELREGHADETNSAEEALEGADLNRDGVKQLLYSGALKPGSWVNCLASAGDLQVVTGSPFWGTRRKVSQWQPYPVAATVETRAVTVPLCGPVFVQDNAADTFSDDDQDNDGNGSFNGNNLVVATQSLRLRYALSYMYVVDPAGKPGAPGITVAGNTSGAGGRGGDGGGLVHIGQDAAHPLAIGEGELARAIHGWSKRARKACGRPASRSSSDRVPRNRP